MWDRPGDLDDSAAYLSRLVVARRFAGLRIGAALLNWACDYARHQYEAELVRIDVWTRNFALHSYYLAQGFQRQEYCRDTSYPSGARFQRPTSEELGARVPTLHEHLVGKFRKLNCSYGPVGISCTDKLHVFAARVRRWPDRLASERDRPAALMDTRHQAATPGPPPAGVNPPALTLSQLADGGHDQALGPMWLWRHYVLTAALLVGRADGSVKALFTAPQQVGIMITAGRRWAAETRNHKIKK